MSDLRSWGLQQAARDVGSVAEGAAHQKGFGNPGWVEAGACSNRGAGDASAGAGGGAASRRLADGVAVVAEVGQGSQQSSCEQQENK